MLKIRVVSANEQLIQNYHDSISGVLGKKNVLNML